MDLDGGKNHIVIFRWLVSMSEEDSRSGEFKLRLWQFKHLE